MRRFNALSIGFDDSTLAEQELSGRRRSAGVGLKREDFSTQRGRGEFVTRREDTGVEGTLERGERKMCGRPVSVPMTNRSG